MVRFRVLIVGCDYMWNDPPVFEIFGFFEIFREKAVFFQKNSIEDPISMLNPNISRCCPDLGKKNRTKNERFYEWYVNFLKRWCDRLKNSRFQGGNEAIGAIFLSIWCRCVYECFNESLQKNNFFMLLPCWHIMIYAVYLKTHQKLSNFLQAKIWQNSWIAWQKRGKDGAKKIDPFLMNGKNRASRLGVYNTYIPQTGRVDFCPVSRCKTDFCPDFCSRAKIGQKFLPRVKLQCQISSKYSETF